MATTNCNASAPVQLLIAHKLKRFAVDHFAGDVRAARMLARAQIHNSDSTVPPKGLAMTLLATMPQPELLVDKIVPDDVVRRQVWGLLAGLYPAGSLPERRADQRFPYPYLIYLTPLQNGQPLPQTVVVAGKHLSERGLGFYHQQPLANRHMIASLQTHDARWLGFLIDITWCRFTQHGWYDSGGRFLQSVVSPVPNLRARQAL